MPEFKITKSGIYPNMATADYYSDPCPTPSLTQSLAKIINDQSPLHAWHAHPRLNPDYQEDSDRKFDVGNIAHKLMIGRGKEIEVLEGFDDWRTKAAKEAREKAEADGRLAVLGKHFAKADRMVRAAREQLAPRGLPFFTDGDGEVVVAWQENGMWLRQMIDWLSPDRRVFVDYKTTDMSAAPYGLSRMMVNAGWPIQAAMAERGLNEVLGFLPLENVDLRPGALNRTSSRDFFFVVQEAEPPHLLTVAKMSRDAMVMGSKQLSRAIEVWSRCMRANRFPGYPLDVVTPEYPGWHEQQWLDREIHEASEARAPARNSMLTDLAGG